jgi:hypothetical protein
MKPKQERSKENALIVLATCSNYIEAAKQLEVTPQTIYEWLKDEDFAAKLELTRNHIVNNAICSMKAHVTKAVDTLGRLLDDPSPQIQRGAANDLINHVSRFIELKDLQKRIEAIEQKSK